jgi:hypothetical protein
MLARRKSLTYIRRRCADPVAAPENGMHDR